MLLPLFLLIDGTNYTTVAVIMPHCGSIVFLWLILLPGFFSSLFFPASYNRISILQQDNYNLKYSLTIAMATLPINKKHIVKDRVIN